jgi:hypothetical protein
MGCGGPYVGGGGGFGGFLSLRAKTCLLNMKPQGAVILPADRVFFYVDLYDKVNSGNMVKKYFLNEKHGTQE